MVLVRQRGAKQRHDAVAHHLVDGALVAVDGFHHPLEDRVEEAACLFGVAISEQLHGALEVGEQHRDQLAFALQAAIAQPGCARPGGAGAGRSGKTTWSAVEGGAAQRLAAAVTEATRRRVGLLAARAAQLERCAAPVAEPCAGRVVLLAAGTLHAGPPRVR